MKPKILVSLTAVLALGSVVALLFVSSQQIHAGTNNQPPPPPPPPVGTLGGPLAGLPSSVSQLFNAGYYEFNVKWDPIRGLGPVFTRATCFTCHGGGNNVITQCMFNPPGVACVDGGSSTILGTRYGKWNPDGTFNYLDGSGTYPENEGGPTLHAQSVSQFGTLPYCSERTIAGAPTGATESGTTVTITTTAPHQFSAGQNAQVLSVPVSGYNGTFSILTVPTSTTFTYTALQSGLVASGGGNASNMPQEVVPADATVVDGLRSTELYGLGLIDAIPESTILQNSGVNKGMGITGVANMVPDQNGNIHAGRFGQKANVPNLLMFTAFAFNNELGITNAYFPVQHLPSGQNYPSRCAPDTSNPEDVNGLDFLQDYQFNELLAPVAPGKSTSQTLAGKAVFENIGCNLCHIESMTTGPNIQLATDLNGGLTEVVGPLSNVTAYLYSDLLLHEMGTGLTGGIPFQPEQLGQATLTRWRTAPLWGLSTRLALGLMHNNKATDLNTAILDHGGEATQVVTAYQGLSSTDQANLFAFLSSL
jgi:hypothetical protein